MECPDYTTIDPDNQGDKNVVQLEETCFKRQKTLKNEVVEQTCQQNTIIACTLITVFINRNTSTLIISYLSFLSEINIRYDLLKPSCNVCERLK